MATHFYPARGADAWPSGCPCCGEAVSEFEPETEDCNALWTFSCGCEIVLDEGQPMIDEDCPDAMRQHLEGLIMHTPDEA